LLWTIGKRKLIQSSVTGKVVPNMLSCGQSVLRYLYSNMGRNTFIMKIQRFY